MGHKEGHFYQVAHSGHPNCRGSQVMAYAAIDRLYKAKVLARTISLIEPETENIVNSNCKNLSRAACHTSAMCWVDPQDKLCKTYGPGTWNYHTVCKGALCKGIAGQLA